MIEEILRDLHASDPAWRIILLRYFTPVGAHSSGLIGENPSGIPSNLMPSVGRVAAGRLPHLNVFGSDYDTPDGTGVPRLHPRDRSGAGPPQALVQIDRRPLAVYNLGTGPGLHRPGNTRAYEKVANTTIPYKTPPAARVTSPPAADPSRAARDLKWLATRGLDQMCADAWRFERIPIRNKGTGPRGSVPYHFSQRKEIMPAIPEKIMSSRLQLRIRPRRDETQGTKPLLLQTRFLCAPTLHRGPADRIHQRSARLQPRQVVLPGQR